MADRAYDDPEMTEEEKAALAELDTATAPPEHEDGTVDPAAKTDQEPAPAADPAKDPAADPAPGAAPADEAAELAEFAKKHAGKTPEQLLELLHAQTKRANAEGFRARKTTETLAQVSERARKALQTRKEQIAGRRQEFDELLKNDPDAAAKRIHDRLLDDEERTAEEDAETIEHNARVDSALELAAAAIPDFGTNIKPTLGFGVEMGYSREEIGAIDDGRHLVTLYLASKFADLVKTGVCDVRGNFLKMPEPVNKEPVDPRLKAPAGPATLSSAPARTNGGGQTAEQQLEAMLGMSDEDFGKLDENVLNGLLNGAGG